MRLQARFLVLFMFLFAVVGSLVALQHTFDLDRSHYVLQNELKQRQSFFTKTVAMDGRQLHSMAVDYSFWDDMVTFIRTGDTTFAHDNIDAGLGTYGADAAWVYRTDRSLVYFSSLSSNSAIRELNLPSGFFTNLYNDHFSHFFIEQAGTLLEIQAATVHPGADDERSTPPQGFLLVARPWNAAYISSLSDLTQSRVKLEPAMAAFNGRVGTDSVTFGQRLYGYNNKSVAVLSSSSSVPVVADLRQVYSRQLYLLMALALATTLVLVGAIWFMVILPLRLITTSLSNESPEMLGRLARQNTEFGTLAVTLQNYFVQETKIKESTFIKAKLVELNQAKSEYLAIAAHELKGSVGNIHLFAQHLTSMLGKRTAKSKLIEETAHISRQARKAGVLINDLYEASKGGQTIAVRMGEFNFDEFIEAEIADAAYSIRQPIIVSGATHTVVMSDRDRLSQVLSNLLQNAAQYSPVANQIRVIIKRVGGVVTIEVQDDGIGIAEIDQPHIFNRFYRSHQVAATYPGLGLGLSICKDIVHALGGKISCHSELRHGSQFFVSIPVKPQA